jgi:hypothetical protein
MCGLLFVSNLSSLMSQKRYNLLMPHVTFNSIQFYSCSIISTTGKVTSQIKICTSHCAVIKYKQISMKLDTHYIYTLQEDIYK